MAVGETTDDTKGVNMWYIILSLAVGGALTTAFSIITCKDMLKHMKLGFKPYGICYNGYPFCVCRYLTIWVSNLLFNMKVI